jgi:hypothetical protein
MPVRFAQILTLLFIIASLQTALADTAPSEFPCEENETHNALDFMVGDWDIVVNGKALAWIKIEKDGRNCLVKEQYGVPFNGHSGAGIDYWDPGDKVWRRILVTSVGTIETFEGEQHNDKFIWEGREERIDGSIVLERVEIWREGDTVRNDIFQSRDEGKTWELTGTELRVARQTSQVPN